MFNKRKKHLALALSAIFILALLYLHRQISNSVGKRPDEIIDTMHNNDNNNGYENSDNLRERLKPKLVSPDHNGVIWDDVGAARSQEDVRKREEGYKMFAFNTLVSSRLSLHRQVPDTRHKACHNLTYKVESLPTASVIVCYHREDLTTLLRTIHSIVDRSPASLLHEIIIVNDMSDNDIVHNVTDHLRAENLTHLVSLITPPERLGLIRARIYGARQATGDVLVFLDSHVEANIHWLEPLLARVKEDRTNVVTPIIDIINADTFNYEPSPLVRGGFNWGLNFKWDAIPRQELQTEADFAKAFKSPTMAGGLFAMDRTYFHELGEYDPGLQVWGGENLELSFRIWMCGGTLEIVPCSRLGHVFRKRRPYGNDGGQEDSMVRNSLRVAHVWMDEYISYYFMVNPRAKNVFYGNITQRVELRKKLDCKSFKWYLENIYPDLLKPKSPPPGKSPASGKKYAPWNKRSRNYKRHFAIRLAGTKFCVQSEREVGEKKAALVLAYCMTRSKVQTWYETDKEELVLSKLLCLDAYKDRPRLMKCHELGGTQEWKFRQEGKTAIYNMAAGLCLTTGGHAHGAKVDMEVCSDSSHMWQLEDDTEEL